MLSRWDVLCHPRSQWRICLDLLHDLASTFQFAVRSSRNLVLAELPVQPSRSIATCLLVHQLVSRRRLPYEVPSLDESTARLFVQLDYLARSGFLQFPLCNGPVPCNFLLSAYCLLRANECMVMRFE